MTPHELGLAAERYFDEQVERALNYEDEPLHEYDPLEEAEARWEFETGR